MTILTLAELGRSVSFGGWFGLAVVSTAAPGYRPLSAFTAPPTSTFLLRRKATWTWIWLPARPGHLARHTGAAPPAPNGSRAKLRVRSIVVVFPWVMVNGKTRGT